VMVHWPMEIFKVVRYTPGHGFQLTQWESPCLINVDYIGSN
jgi:hypothetical protein